MKQKIILTAVLLLLLLVGGTAYGLYADDLGQLSAKIGLRQTAVEPQPTPPPPTLAVDRGDVEDTIIGPGQLSGVKEQLISTAVGGHITQLTVRPGDRVQAGDIIAQIDPRPYEDTLALAELKLAQAEEALARQIVEAELAIQTAETNVNINSAGYPTLTAAEINLAQAQRNLADVQGIYNKAFDPGREWELSMGDGLTAERDAASRQLQMAQESVAIAQAELEKIQSQSWAASQNVSAAQISLEQRQIELENLLQQGVDPLLQWDVDKAKADLEATTIVAPFDAVVVKVEGRLGEQIAAGQPLLELADVSQGEVMVTVIEEDLSLVQPGLQAHIYFDAYPDDTVPGVVDRVVPLRMSDDRPVYPVYIQIDALPDNLLPGMTADAVIVVDRREDVLRLPRALVRASADNTATVQVWNGRETETRQIEVGLRGDTYVEILSGLAEGELVVGQ